MKNMKEKRTHAVSVWCIKERIEYERKNSEETRATTTRKNRFVQKEKRRTSPTEYEKTKTKTQL